MKVPSLIVLSLFVPLFAQSEERIHKVVRTDVREDGLVATCLRPKGNVTRPAILVVGGSEGGVPKDFAYRFAERGWTSLAVAYFGAEGLPKTLANVPLEYFDTAVGWLKRQPLVATNDLAIVGTSRGGELALLVAAHNPSFKRVIAFVPSSVVWGPVGPHDASVSAWTLNGRPLPFVRPVKQPDYSAKPYYGTRDFLAALQQTSLVEAAVIPVEKIQGTVLLISGDDDQVWPSSLMSRMVMKRLAGAQHPYQFEHLSFRGAGHGIVPGFDPGLIEARHPTGVVIALGGDKKANRDAQENGWTKVLEFLKADIHSGASEE